MRLLTVRFTEEIRALFVDGFELTFMGVPRFFLTRLPNLSRLVFLVFLIILRTRVVLDILLPETKQSDCQ